MILLICISSCDPETLFKVRRVIENESLESISLNVYNNGSIIENIKLANGQSNTKDEICKSFTGTTRCDRLSELDIRWDNIADSIVLVFNQERTISFCGFISNCTFEERNLLLFPLHIENGEHHTGYVKTIEGDTQVFTFTITEEDYKDAEPIGG